MLTNTPNNQPDNGNSVRLDPIRLITQGILISVGSESELPTSVTVYKAQEGNLPVSVEFERTSSWGDEPTQKTRIAFLPEADGVNANVIVSQSRGPCSAGPETFRVPITEQLRSLFEYLQKTETHQRWKADPVHGFIAGTDPRDRETIFLDRKEVALSAEERQAYDIYREKEGQLTMQQFKLLLDYKPIEAELRAADSYLASKRTGASGETGRIVLAGFLKLFSDQAPAGHLWFLLAANDFVKAWPEMEPLLSCGLQANKGEPKGVPTRGSNASPLESGSQQAELHKEHRWDALISSS